MSPNPVYLGMHLQIDSRQLYIALYQLEIFLG